jgi:glycosyltransferase involved in cell wall biosynthesis
MIHVAHIIANNSSVPYFTWFAQLSLKTPGVRLSFIALHSEKPAMIEEMAALGIPAFWIHFDASKRSSSMLRALPALYKLLRKIKPDVVHTHLFDDSLPALFAARLARVPVRVITKQDTAFHWYYASKGVRYDRRNNRNATHLVAVSEECREFILEKEKADPKKVRLVHHGIPLGKLTDQNEEAKKRLKEKYGLNGKIVVGTVARLIDWKGYRHIIEAAKKLVPHNPQLRFVFAGEGQQKTELTELIKQAGLTGEIIFTGFVAREDIPSLYGIMDIYLHAAFMEPFGFVIAEAMANAVPVVSTPTGAARDAIRDGQNGILAKYADADSIAAGVQKLLDMPETERKQLGTKGRITAGEMFPVEKMWNGYLEIYRNALNKT